jgi:ribonuclease HII
MENKLRRDGKVLICGIDEVGRGCLAGPLVAAAVVLPQNLPRSAWRGIKDSKQLSPEARRSLGGTIQKQALAWAVSEVPPKKVDALNIHRATLLAMQQAVDKVILALDAGIDETFLFIDGRFTIPELVMEQEAVVAGDRKLLSIAAASIIAKVYRDELMARMHEDYPKYKFNQHKGYGTSLHREAIKEHGLSAIHRVSFCGKIV